MVFNMAITNTALMTRLESRFIGTDVSILECLASGYVFISTDPADNRIYCGIPQYDDVPLTDQWGDIIPDQYADLGYYVLAHSVDDTAEALLECDPAVLSCLGEPDDILAEIKALQADGSRDALLMLASIFNSCLGSSYCGVDYYSTGSERSILMELAGS